MEVKNKPELLCPVGGMQQLIAAVENGADAVYLGGSLFNARMYADNFDSIENIEKAVDYAHLRNVKVYVTINILINDSEMEEAIIYAGKLYELGVDAVIVQDIGLAAKISREIPGLKIHISTQATVYSKEGIEYFNRYNSVERVVLARELSLKEIEDIIKNTDKEIEVFVHGALCVCYSGQCKLSSQIGARSGNRGKCAQPCRLSYKLKGENLQLKDNYYLSTKDICTLSMLPKLVSIGVHSLKIEGRMKSPEYVAAVTRVYRKYIDKCFEKQDYLVEKQDIDTLLQVFNRGNFSSGYYEGKDSKNIWCNDKPKHLGTYLGIVEKYDKRKKNIYIKLEQDVSLGDVIEVSNNELSSSMISFIRKGADRVKIAQKGDTVILGDIDGDILTGNKVHKITSKILNDELRKSFDLKSIKKNKLDVKVNLKINEVPEVIASTDIFGIKYDVTIKEGSVCERGITKTLTNEDIITQFSKTNDVPFVLNKIDINLEPGVMTSVSNLNNMRRKVIETLSNNIIESFKCDKVNFKEQTKRGTSIYKLDRLTKCSIYVHDLQNIDDLSVLNEADRVYISLEDILKNKDKIKRYIDKEKVCIYLPTITTVKYKQYMLKNIDVIKEFKNILITNIEHIEIFKNIGINIYLDNSFNAFNSDTVNVLFREAVKGINLSNELTLDQINNIAVNSDKEIEIDMYGNVQLMYSNFCILKATKNCGKCREGKYTLKDRKDREFPILFDRVQCTTKILNSDKLFCKDAIMNLNNKIDYMRLYIYDESSKEIERVINTFKQLLKGVEETHRLVSSNEQKYTNGHFYKEV